jgi:hypothetical protein
LVKATRVGEDVVLAGHEVIDELAVLHGHVVAEDGGALELRAVTLVAPDADLGAG